MLLLALLATFATAAPQLRTLFPNSGTLTPKFNASILHYVISTDNSAISFTALALIQGVPIL